MNSDASSSPTTSAQGYYPPGLGGRTSESYPAPPNFAEPAPHTQGAHPHPEEEEKRRAGRTEETGWKASKREGRHFVLSKAPPGLDEAPNSKVVKLDVASLLLALIMLFYLVASYAILRDAFSTMPAEPVLLHPPPDIISDGRLKMAEEMREWADEKE